MKILKALSDHRGKLHYAVGGIVLLMITIGVVLPSTLRVKQETTIDANPATIFALLNDFGQIN